MTTNKPKYTLGRIQVEDKRDQNYPLSKALPPKSAEELSHKYWWDSAWWGDQGRTSQCVAYSWTHWLEDGPVTHFYENREFDPSYLNESRDEKHQPLFNPASIYSEAQKVDAWPGECVDTETTCLTKRGWKSYDSLIVGEEILTFNLKTEMTEWLPLEKVHVHQSTDYKIWGNKGMEFACTDNHKWPVRSRISKGCFTLVETQDWKSKHEFLRAAKCNLPDHSEWSDDFVALVAWVTAEGHCRPDHHRGNGVVVSQKVYLQEVATLMETHKVASGYRKKDGCHVWEISGHLAKQIRMVAPGRAPKIDWLMQLTQRQLELFIEVCVKGDGCVTPTQGNRKERRILSRKTGPILDSLLAACVLAGQSVSRASHGKGSGLDVENWTLRNSQSVEIRKLHEITKTNGTVWCPQTQNRTFIARRGKSVFITGNSYDGTSVRAGAKILQRLGVISEYRWASTLDDVVQAVLHLGPVVVGTWWYSDMFTPDSNGVITATGTKSGGHAYVINGVNLNKKQFRIKNSWGRGWGKKGHAYISFSDFDKLLKDWGEACMAFEKKLLS